MATVKKSSFFLNKSFSAKNRFKMQRYLNEMSADGLHINKIGKFSCTFTEDASVRYVYSICGEGEEAIYTTESGWTHFCNYKGVMFFRRTVPVDAVKLTRRYKKKQETLEKGWLNARLKEGLLLIGRIGDEYIFQRTREYEGYEYIIKRPKKQKRKLKDGEEFSPLGATENLIFLSANDSGSAYYFIKDESAKRSVMENRGKRLSDQLFAVMLATASAISLFACVALMIYGLMLDKTMMTVCLIGGGCGALVFAVMFGVYFKKFQRIAEARRIRKEERRLKAESEAMKNSSSSEKQSEQKPLDATNNNTVVMNVVMNNYGKRDTMQGMGINSLGQLYDSDLLDKSNPALDPNINPAIAAAADPEGFANAVMKRVQYGDAADTLVQGEGEEDGLWQTSAFGPSDKKNIPLIAQTSSYTDDDWVSTDDDNEDENGEKNSDSFPLLTFIGNALVCFIAVSGVIFGLRFGIAWFISRTAGDVLFLLVSVLAVAFSPFMFRFGFTNCKQILKENATDDDYEE